MSEENETMEMFDIMQVLKEISKYNVSKEGIIDFLFQDKKDDTAFFYYKNMLLQLMELDGHFDGLSKGYKNYRMVSRDYRRNVLNSFLYGDTTEIKKIFNYASELSDLPNGKNAIKWEEIIKMAKEWQSMTSHRDTLKTQEKNTDEIDVQIEAKKQQIRDVFASINMQSLGEIVIENLHYESAYNIDMFAKSAGENLKLFKEDAFAMTKMTKILADCLMAMKNHKDLDVICRGIRTALGKTRARTDYKWESGVRTINLANDNDFISNSSKIDTLNDDYNKLREQYQEVLAEEDETEFIKKCADFHFDFTRVHPFSDGNGRTSRILLSMMLATRNIMLPSLYTGTIDKFEFYTKSNTALEGDYSTIEQELFERLGHFYPLVMPRIDSKQANQEVNINDMEVNFEGIGAQERNEAIPGVKELSENAKEKTAREDNEEVQQ